MILKIIVLSGVLPGANTRVKVAFSHLGIGLRERIRLPRYLQFL